MCELSDSLPTDGFAAEAHVANVLRYLANGHRQMNEAIPPNWRTNWEFYAIITGRVAPIFHSDDRPALQEKMLWVFPPESCHGWISTPHHTFHRIALHFSSVPHALETAVRQQGTFFSKPLNDDEIARFKAIAAELEPHFLRPTVLSSLHFQARLLDLAVLALGGHDVKQPPNLPNLAAFKVESALSWFTVNIARNPTIEEVAAAIHVSPSHLRRLFWEVRQKSPKAAFHQVQLEKAQELMSRSSLTLEEIARHCGFASASHLCRAYKQTRKFTPTFWRKRIVAKFLDPAATTEPVLTPLAPLHLPPHPALARRAPLPAARARTTGAAAVAVPAEPYASAS